MVLQTLQAYVWRGHGVLLHLLQMFFLKQTRPGSMSQIGQKPSLVRSLEYAPLPVVPRCDSARACRFLLIGVLNNEFRKTCR